MAKKATKKAPAPKKAAPAKKPKLLSGGNPQIAKGYGNEAVQAYIAAMPEWKKDIGKRIDDALLAVTDMRLEMRGGDFRVAAFKRLEQLLMLVDDYVAARITAPPHFRNEIGNAI